MVYGNKGFIQYQFVIPKKNSIVNLKKILKTVNDHNEFSSLAVLKLLGKNNNNYLSFPMEGLTMALDFKLSNSIIKLIKFLDERSKNICSFNDNLFASLWSNYSW